MRVPSLGENATDDENPDDALIRTCHVEPESGLSRTRPSGAANASLLLWRGSTARQWTLRSFWQTRFSLPGELTGKVVQCAAPSSLREIPFVVTA